MMYQDMEEWHIPSVQL